MNFTSHNIQLDNGSLTKAEVPLLASLQLCQALIRTLNLHFRAEERSQIKIADLGCLEGGYSVEFARNGYQATGFEAREDNIQKCNYIADHLSLPNLKFIKDDIKNLENYGQFDVIFCSGLLYHLDKPVEYLNLLGRVTKKMLMLNTHYSLEKDPLYDNPLFNKLKRKIEKRISDSVKSNHSLSKLTTNENIYGRWFSEYEMNAQKKDIEKSLWAAYSNYRSFWPTKKYLLQAVIESGFQVVYEQYDFLENIITDNYIEKLDRSLFICLK